MQTLNTIQPRNASEALRFAKTAERAAQILKDGYTFSKDADSEVIAVCKPGRLAAAYWINLMEPGCDCPDYLHRGDYCKHILAYDMHEAQEEEKMFEAQCAAYEARMADAECANGVDYLL